MIDTLPEDLLDDVSAAIAAAPASRHHRSMAEQENAMQPDREDELSTLRDIARRASVLVRWFSRDDAPWVGLSAQQRAALDRDAETLTDALHRAGHYVEGWGN